MGDRRPSRRSGYRPARFGLPIALVRLVLGAVLVGGLIVGGTVFRVWQVARVDDRGKADVVVVLGAAQYDGTPSAVLGSRLDHAARLWRDGVAPVIVTVGGRRVGDTYTEAQAGRNYLASYGVPEAAVVQIGEGRDTLESLRAVARRASTAGWHTAVIVSDPWHSLRARTMSDDRAHRLDLADPKRSYRGDAHHSGSLHRPGECRAAGLPVDACPRARLVRH